jgi:transposase
LGKKRVDCWVVTDEFWQRVEPLVPQRVLPDKQYVRKPGAGRPAKPARQVFEGIVYVLRTGCQWKALPGERFGSASAIHKRFLEWEKAGFFEALWKAGLAEYDDMQGIAWRWQSIDAAMMKAPLAQEAVGANPTDRGKKGCKRLDEVLTATVVKRKDAPHRRSKHLCADAGYRGAEHLRTIEDHGYIPHVVGRRTEADIIKRREPKKKARRWVVEVCHSWFNRFRKLPVRYEKLERSFVALNHLAAAIIALRKVPHEVNIIYG